MLLLFRGAHGNLQTRSRSLSLSLPPSLSSDLSRLVVHCAEIAHSKRNVKNCTLRLLPTLRSHPLALPLFVHPSSPSPSYAYVPLLRRIRGSTYARINSATTVWYIYRGAPRHVFRPRPILSFNPIARPT